MIKFFIKLFFSLGILWLLAYSVDIKSLQDSLRAINYETIIYVLCLILLIRFIMALRWKLLLSYYHINASILKLLEILFVSNAVGYLLPSGLGTDIIRTYELSRNEGNSEKILASVFLDRVFGLISMILLALFASWYAYYSDQIDYKTPAIITFSALMLPIVFLAARFILSHGINKSGSGKVFKKISTFYNKFISALHKTAMPTSGLCALIILSVSVQLIRSLMFVVIFIGMGVDIALIQYFIFIPVVFILMLIPISIGGLGVRESALYAFFGPLGLSIATCTVAGLVFHALQLIMIVPGLILLMLRK